MSSVDAARQLGTTRRTATPGDESKAPEHAGALQIGRGVSAHVVGMAVLIAATLLCVFALVSLRSVIKTNQQTMEDDQRYMKCEAAIDDLQMASDFLTTQARMYVMTGDRYYLDAYLEELLETDRRGKALDVLGRTLDQEKDTLSLLTDALWRSNELAQTELYAMRLAAAAYGLDELPEYLAQVQLGAHDLEATTDELLAKAKDEVIGERYDRVKGMITKDVDAGTKSLIDGLEEHRVADDDQLDRLLLRLQVTIHVLLGIILLAMLAIFALVLRPLTVYSHAIKQGLALVPQGSQELLTLADSYNAIYAENLMRTELWQHAAEHDPLTGLRNRGSYDELLSQCGGERYALVLIDIDHFKEFNDTYGHEMGDCVLCKVAGSICRSVRESDHPCRIGGDEFAIIMGGMAPELRDILVRRIEAIRESLSQGDDEIPPVHLSIGVAFAGPDDDSKETFRKADEALYLVKDRGRDGYAIYGEERAS